MKKTKKMSSVLFLSILIVLGFAGCRPRTEPGFQAQREEAQPVPREYINYMEQGGTLELPIQGASGFTAKDLPLLQVPNDDADVIKIMEAGRGFTILDEYTDFWYVEVGGITGWVKHHFCMINMPDVIPSIVFNITNAYSSMFRTSGFDIPNITGEALYSAWDFNARLGREEFIVPVLYGMVRRIFAAQQAALADGNTLIIYEAFRPAEPHERLYREMAYMARNNPVIFQGLNYGTFRSDFFLAPSPYNHQRGTAIDVSLGRIVEMETRTTGNFKYTHITRYIEYEMQTPMHELSVAAAVFTRWVPARTFTGWLHGEFVEHATPATRLLQRYMTDAGLTPLASEWWHFNDLNWSPPLVEVGLTGEFFIERTYSRPPSF